MVRRFGVVLAVPAAVLVVALLSACAQDRSEERRPVREAYATHTPDAPAKPRKRAKPAEPTEASTAAAPAVAALPAPPAPPAPRFAPTPAIVAPPAAPAPPPAAKEAPPPPQAPTIPPARPGSNGQKLIDDGRALFKEGKVLAARERFVAALTAPLPDVLLELARSYDQNYLDKLPKTDAEADLDRARALYEQAVSLGSTAAAEDLARLRGGAPAR